VDPADNSGEEFDIQIKQKKSYFGRLCGTYDKNFLLSLGLQYFNNGSKVMAILALLDIFKSEFGLEPATTQSYMAIMVLPWAPKLLYGIVADTFPICGSRKRSYIILMGLLQALFAGIVALDVYKSAEFFLTCATIVSFTGAFMDVVVDGMMVVQ